MKNKNGIPIKCTNCHWQSCYQNTPDAIVAPCASEKGGIDFHPSYESLSDRIAELEAKCEKYRAIVVKIANDPEQRAYRAESRKLLESEGEK